MLLVVTLHMSPALCVAAAAAAGTAAAAAAAGRIQVLPCCTAIMRMFASAGSTPLAAPQQQMLLANPQPLLLPALSQRLLPQLWPSQHHALHTLQPLYGVSSLQQQQQQLAVPQVMWLRTRSRAAALSRQQQQQQPEQQMGHEEQGASRHRQRSSPQQQQQQHYQQQQQHYQQQQHQQQGSLSPAQVTKLIMSADTPRELLQCVVTHHEVLNHIHIIAALNQAATLWPQTATPPNPLDAADAPRTSHIQHQSKQQTAAGPDAAAVAGGSSSSSEVKLIGRQQLERLMQQLSGPLMRALPQYGAREISSALWSYAHCGLQPPAELIQACVQELCSWDKLRQALPQHIVNLAWAATKLGCKDTQLFSHIAAAAVTSRLQHYTPGQLSVLSWAITRANYQDTTFGLVLTARAVELLQRQLQQQQQQQQGRQQQQQRGAWQWQFDPMSLAGVIWASASMRWLAPTPELMQLATAVAKQEPYVYGFTPRAAANYVWGFAATLGGNSSSSNSRQSFNIHQQRQQQQQVAVVDSVSPLAAEGMEQDDDDHIDGENDDLDHSNSSSSSSSPSPPAAPPSALLLVVPEAVWQSCLAVTAAALRRLDEADGASLSRLLWSCATLYNWVHRSTRRTAITAGAPGLPGTAQRRADDGRVVFDQLCSALSRHWQQQPHSFGPSAVVTLWGLIAADRSGLWKAAAAAAVNDGGQNPDALPAPQQQQQQLQQQEQSPPTLLLQQLLDGVKAAGRQQQLSVGTIASLAVACADLQPRLEGAALLQAHRAAEEAGSDQSSSQQEDAAQPQAEGSPAAAQLLLGELPGAVDALAAAAWQHAGTPGALEVHDVSRFLTSFCRLQVDDNALYHDLLQHWSLEALQGCTTPSLLAALHAAAVFTTSKPDLVQSDSQTSQAWEHLLTACSHRWGSLTTQQQRRAAVPIRVLCTAGKGVVAEGVLEGLLVETVGGGSAAAAAVAEQ